MTNEERQAIIDATDSSIDAHEGKLYFRHDVFPEATSKENWTRYCEIQEQLKELGWELIDPYIEHDCVSGQIERVKPCLESQ
jgi:hypothetical protein